MSATSAATSGGMSLPIMGLSSATASVSPPGAAVSSPTAADAPLAAMIGLRSSPARRAASAAVAHSWRSDGTGPPNAA